MPNNIQIIDPAKYKGWDELLLQTPDHSFFHTSVWAKVLRDSYGYIPLYFAILGSGGIRALIPVMEVNSFLTGKRGVSLPFTDFCDPIIDEGIQLQDVLEDIVEFGRKCGWKYVELRGGQNHLTSTLPSSSYYNHTLELCGDAEKRFQGFRKGTKSSIKKAEKEGVAVKIQTSLDSVKEFYRLSCITRKHHGLPPQPYSFFEKVHRYVISTGFGIVNLAWYKNSCIAGGIFFSFGDSAIYKYGASDREHQHLSANNLIVWKAIEYYVNLRLKSLCFGKTNLENEGLRIFKRGWGAKESALHYYKFDLRTNAFVKSRPLVSGVHNQFFRRLPPFLSRWVGAALYRHFA